MKRAAELQAGVHAAPGQAQQTSRNENLFLVLKHLGVFLGEELSKYERVLLRFLPYFITSRSTANNFDQSQSRPQVERGILDLREIEPAPMLLSLCRYREGPRYN